MSAPASSASVATSSLSIIVPAFNEAARIGLTVSALQSYLPTLGLPWELRIVDDGSRDQTAAIVESLSRVDPRVVLQREPHRGKGGTIRAGMLAARTDLRFMCDADLSMPVTELARFLELVPSRFDIVIGSREGTGARRIGEPAYRHVMGRAFNALVRSVAMPAVHDTQCGFKLFTGTAADAVFSRTTIDGWAFDIEALVIASQLDMRVHEMPIEWHYRELSRVSPGRDSLLMARDVLRIRWNAARGTYNPPRAHRP
jgi:dolichyl-phosphate beta-glucosyltransferase